MNELIQGINLPKEILDKAEKVIATIFGPSAKELGELFADRIRYKRLKNQVNIFSKTAILLEKNKLQAKELKLNTIIPLIEQSSLEEDEILQTKWANLIVNMCSSPESGLEPKLVKTLSNLSVLEAQVLDFVFERFVQERQIQFDKSQNSKYFKYKSIEEVKLAYVTIKFLWIKEHFNLTDEFTKICTDNLESLGLIRYEEPEIEIKNDSKNKVHDDEQGQYVDLDIYATYNQSDNFYLTTYGFYFVNQCKNR